jgi:hypothetical protein
MVKKHINGTFSHFSFPCLMTIGYQFDFEKNQGKEGPNVHLAACIARVVDPKFFAKRVESSSSVKPSVLGRWDALPKLDMDAYGGSENGPPYRQSRHQIPSGNLTVRYGKSLTNSMGHGVKLPEGNSGKK